MLSFIPQSLLICYVFFGLYPSEINLYSAKSSRHPLHLTSTELNYNTKENTIEISCRIFTDDFEDGLARKFKVKTDLSAASKHKEMDALVQKYMAERIQFAANGKLLTVNYLGFENDKEAVVVYMESVPVKGLRKLETTCTVLYDLFDDQTNIFHVMANGNRKSAKLTYPDKKLVSVF